MTHKSNLAVVDAEESTRGTLVAASLDATTPKAPLSAGEIEENVPLPAVPTLQDLIREIPVTTPPSSRLLRGVTKGGVTRSANKLSLDVVVAEEGDAVRVWVKGPIIHPSASAGATGE